MPAVDADVVFVAEGRDREIARHAILAGLGFGVFDCPAGVAVFLAQLGWLCRPLRGNAACLDVALFAVGIALLGCGDNRGVDDLAAHRQKPSRRERGIKALKQDLDRRFPPKLGARQRLAKVPDRIGVRHRIGEVQPEKTHKRQPVADQVFGALVRQIVTGLQNQRLEHQHVIERRAAAFRAVRAWHRAFEIRPEQLEIHHGIQPFQAVALGRKLLQPLINVEKPRLSPHPHPPMRNRLIASQTDQNRQVFGGLQLVWASLAAQADKEGWPAGRFLAALAEHEIAERSRRRLERHLAEARLPLGKTLDSFDFEAVPVVSKAQVMALAAGDVWLNNGANLLLFGPPGGGKSHLAAALGFALVENGWRVLFTRTTDLVQRLQIARRELALEAIIAKLDKFHLLILDDLAYVTKDQAETSVLFELISARYERRSLLITANQPFGEWGKVFPDQAMTVAVVDRLVHHATIFEMNVESYRRRAARERKRGRGRPPIHATTAANT